MHARGQHFELGRSDLALVPRRTTRTVVPIILLTVPVNLRDWRPNVSVASKDLPARRTTSLKRDIARNGFALAAATVMLVERYGHVFAYWSMAAGLAAVGLIAGLAVRVKEQEEEVAEEKAEAEDTSKVASEVAAQAPLALLGGLFTLPGAPGTALKIAKVLGNNYALVLLLVLIGALFWPTDKTTAPETRAGDGEPVAPVPPPENVVAFAEQRRSRNGAGAWVAVIAIGLGVALAVASIFLVDPIETKRAVMARMGW